ncbi:hydrolase, partial [[Kitasatospora] papulosa]
MRMHRSPRLVATAVLGTALAALAPLSPAHATSLPSVGATAETAALYDDEAGGNANADDPAIWRNDADPG